jgi:hypothetical protein
MHNVIPRRKGAKTGPSTNKKDVTDEMDKIIIIDNLTKRKPT